MTDETRDSALSGAGERSVLARLEADGRLTGPRTMLVEAGAEDAAAVVEVPRSGERYEVLGEIARGGIGVVLRSRDVDLGRDVAMKVMRDEHVANDDVVTRFVEEAQIGGQLQHPGIVPVYEMGLRPDGRPYFTMKLVKGRTLAQLLEQRKDAADGRRRLLGVFEAVCRTMAYAHARGVVHRDLKPANVMVGAFGETQVVDWGLAKVMGQGGDERRPPTPRPDVSVIATVRGGDTTAHSRVGSVLGTPAYMPPEQARGDVDAVSERSDVFALGAILCEILTGAPPYPGPPERLIEQAAASDLSSALARLDACGADAKLVALTKQCLAPAPAARPKDAGAVAEAVAASFAAAEERAREAQVAAAKATIRAKQAARSRRLTVALAAAVLVAVAAGGGGWWLFAATRAERVAEADRAVDAKLSETAEIEGRARASESKADWDEAAKSAEAAVALAEGKGAGEAARARAMFAMESSRRQAAAAAARDAREQRDAKTVDLLEEIRLESWDVAEALADARYAAAFGVSPENVSAESLVETLAGGARSADLAAALDAWAELRERMKEPAAALRAAARAIDPDPWRAKLRGSKTREELALLAKEADVASLPPLTSVSLGDALGGRGDAAGAVGLFARIHDAHPGDFGVNSRFAYWLRQVRPRRNEEALRYALAALARKPRSAALWNNLGVVYEGRNEVGLARTAYREALRLNADFAVAHANDARLALSQVTSVGAGLDAVIDRCRRAIGLDPKCLEAYRVLGNALYSRGDVPGAVEAFREGARARPDAALARLMASAALFLLGRHDEAEDTLKAAIPLDPDAAGLRRDLGNLLSARWRHAEAVEQFLQATRLEPDDAVLRSQLVWALFHDRRTRAAIEEARTAVRISRGSRDALFNLAAMLKNSGDFTGGLRAHAALSVVGGGDFWVFDTRVRLGDVDDAMIDALEELGAIYPGSAAASRCVRSNALMFKRRFREAASDLRRARDSEPGLLGIGLTSAYVDARERDLRRLEEMGAELDSYASGTPPAAPLDRLAVALWAGIRGRCAASASLWESALAADPSLLADPRVGRGVEAAAQAALAAAGHGDGAALDAGGRARMRGLAFAWLSTELRHWTRLVDEEGARVKPVVAGALGGWYYKGELAGVRDREALAQLPPDEARAWNELWDQTAALLARASRL